MSIRINNQPGADALRSINVSYRSLLKTMEKLSSGRRINRASDDPAGLVISEQMRAQIASLNQQIENTSLTIRKYNTADATINQLYSILHGLRSMAVAAADDSSGDAAAREAYQAAAERAVANYNAIIQTASFNDAHLLDGSEGSLTQISSLGTFDLSSPESATQSILQIEQALSELNRAHVEIGSTQKYDLEARRSNLEVTVQNLTAAESQIADTDYALTVVEMIREEIKLKAGVAMLAHANLTRQSVLSLMRS